MNTYTITVYVVTDEDPRNWDVADCIGEGVVGWDVAEGHGDDCAACNSMKGDDA